MADGVFSERQRDEGYSMLPREEEQIAVPESDQLIGDPRGNDGFFLRWQQDLKDELLVFEFQMKGFENKNGCWLIPKDNKPTKNAILNETGCNHIMMVLRSNFLKVVGGSNFKVEDVHKMCNFVEKGIIYMLRDHYKEYGIKRPQDADVIRLMIFKPYFALCMQSLENGNRRFWGGLMKYNENSDNSVREGSDVGRGKGFSLLGFGRR
jgi:hypothetical protein